MRPLALLSGAFLNFTPPHVPLPRRLLSRLPFPGGGRRKGAPNNGTGATGGSPPAPARTHARGRPGLLGPSRPPPRAQRGRSREAAAGDEGRLVRHRPAQPLPALAAWLGVARPRTAAGPGRSSGGARSFAHRWGLARARTRLQGPGRSARRALTRSTQPLCLPQPHSCSRAEKAAARGRFSCQPRGGRRDGKRLSRNPALGTVNPLSRCMAGGQAGRAQQPSRYRDARRARPL